VGTAQLERDHRLHVLALQQHLGAGARGQAGHVIERGLDGHIIDTRLENAFDVGLAHGRVSYLKWVLPMVSTSPSCRSWRPTRWPFTMMPLVLLRSSTIQ